jgi:hypothetical protein
MTSVEHFEKYRLEALGWLAKQYYFLPTREIENTVALRFMTEAQRGVLSYNSGPVQRFMVVVQEFQNATGACATILLPCNDPRHHQPCLCPFQWFRLHRGVRRMRVTRSLAVLTEASAFSDAADVLDLIKSSCESTPDCSSMSQS